MNDTAKHAVEDMITRASCANKPEDASMYAQAALHAAGALHALAVADSVTRRMDHDLAARAPEVDPVDTTRRPPLDIVPPEAREDAMRDTVDARTGTEG